jgi:hypothetical protein
MAAADLLGAIDEAELASLAAAIPIPVDAFGPSRAYVEAVSDGPDHALNAPCSHRSGFRVYFGRDGGRRREPVGPVFDRPREAVRLAELLMGASDTDGSTGGPVSAELAQTRVCMVCEQPLPAVSRPHRRTCSPACRQRLGRQAGAAERSSRPGPPTVMATPPSRPVAGPAQLALGLLTPSELAAVTST